MRFLTKRNMKSWLSHWVAWLAGAPSLHVTRPYRIDISRNQTLKLLFCLSYFDFACSLNYTVHLLMKRCNMSFSCVVFFSFVCNSFFLFLFFFSWTDITRFILWVLMSPWGMNVKWYMKCFIYWSSDLKSSKRWSSQWKQFNQLRIEASSQRQWLHSSAG